jgi:membrane-bound ClpP family serine protease
MDPILWSVVLLVLALGFFLLELFIPSGGILGVAAAACIVGAVIVGFTISLRAGVIVFGITTVLIPAVVAAAIRWWPDTPIGRLIVLGRPEHPDDVLPDTEVYRGLKQLIGRHGMAETSMLPSGIVSIDGSNYDAMSEGVPIEVGAVVQVIDVRTNRVIVRPASNTHLPDDLPTSDTLSQPFESLGIDGLEDSLG